MATSRFVAAVFTAMLVMTAAPAVAEDAQEGVNVGAGWTGVIVETVVGGLPEQARDAAGLGYQLTGACGFAAVPTSGRLNVVVAGAAVGSGPQVPQLTYVRCSVSNDVGQSTFSEFANGGPMTQTARTASSWSWSDIVVCVEGFAVFGPTPVTIINLQTSCSSNVVGVPQPTPPQWVERTLFQTSVPVTTPPVPAFDADLVRVQGQRSPTDPRNYEVRLWFAGQPSPTNPVSVFTGGMFGVPVDVSLLHTPPVPSQSAELRVTLRHRYDPTQVVCLVGVGSTCVKLPVDPLNVTWPLAGTGAELALEVALVVNGQALATQTVRVPLVGQLLAAVP